MTKKDEIFISIWKGNEDILKKQKSSQFVVDVFMAMEEYGKHCALQSKNKYLTEATAMLKGEIKEFTMFDEWWDAFKAKEEEK